MRCHACDRALSDKEISWNDDLKTWELCTVCLDVALDAAFCDGFSIDGEDAERIVMDTSFDNYGDSCDVVSIWDIDDEYT